ncbi:MAG: aminoacyl-tRNA hydrolase [Oscillospiraceae bacterium]|nr:aminoacyl-tRNA hydrolase [Oscillospiraceae bacterium]
MIFKSSGCDWMVVGLGNPGKEYELTRHNVGFRATDLVAGLLKTRIDRLKFKALTRLVSWNGKKVLLVQPQTYMNLSGAAVGALASYYKVKPERILVIFDDISLPPGRIRIRKDGSAGGHNGIKSIIQSLGSDQFPRIKVGVGAKPHPDYDLADWVLSRFSAQEEKALAPALQNAADAALLLMEQGVEKAASAYNGK